jgi:hypothetical protein
MSCGKRDIRFQDGPESRMVEQAERNSPSVIRIRRSGPSMNVPNIQTLTPLWGIVALLVCVLHFQRQYGLKDEILEVTSF